MRLLSPDHFGFRQRPLDIDLYDFGRLPVSLAVDPLEVEHRQIRHDEFSVVVPLLLHDNRRLTSISRDVAQQVSPYLSAYAYPLT